MSNMKADVVDVKGAFPKGGVGDGEEIHIRIPQGWKNHCKNDEVFRLKFHLYGLK